MRKFKNLLPRCRKNFYFCAYQATRLPYKKIPSENRKTESPMLPKKIYTDELQTARALIARNPEVTRHYFYRQCYPLFKSIFDNYHTDCESVKELIDEIYLVVLAPSQQTGRCQMENYRGESSLAAWLKSACLFYCYHRFEIKERMPRYEALTHGDFSDDDEAGDRYDQIYGSVEMDINNLNRLDVLAILHQMPNQRYSELIRLRYLEQYTNEETAGFLGMSMDNYYNKHKLAKAQFERICRKEAGNA